MTMPRHAEQNQRLVDLSRKAAAVEPIDWMAQLDPRAFCFSPELISLAGTDAYGRLGPAARRRLSLFEAANFFSLNVHGERFLVSGLADRMAVPRFAEHRAYLRHFMEEERRHTAMFTAFCCRYANGVYPDRSIPLADGDGPDADLLFFARIAIFEEIVDTFNRAMAKDARLDGVARAVNRAHHLDEARHLSFGHRLLHDLVAERSTAWTPADRTKIARCLQKFTEQVWAGLFNPSVYRDAGLHDVYALRREATASAAAHRRRTWALRGAQRLLWRLDLTKGDRA